MRNTRRIVQVLFFILFLYLFVAATYPLPGWIPVGFFLKLDPLTALITMLAGHRILLTALLWALPVLGLTLLAGRVFCGWICPLGTTIDASDRLFFPKAKPRKDWEPRRIKHYVLIACVVAAVFGAQIAFLFDPIPLITRSFTMALGAPIQMILRSASLRFPGLGSIPFVSVDQSFFRMNLLTLAMLAIVLGLGIFGRRFWCRNLCPLGAMLGLISWAPLLKRRVGESCNDCLRCARDCKMGAIENDPRRYAGPECIQCYTCVAVCPKDAITIRPQRQPTGRTHQVDLLRRRVLQSGGLAVASVAMGRTELAAKHSQAGPKLGSAQLIRPPGALPEDGIAEPFRASFLSTCIRCGECMKVCPTNALQPALLEGGMEGIWTPLLVPRVGPCTQECNYCGQVCPSGAIEPFSIPEKSHLFVGTAVIDRNNCLAWAGERTCLVCDEHCSYHALHWKEVDGRRRPFVNEKKCVGCGLCEFACPIQPTAAIRVFSFGDKRQMSREEQKEWQRRK